MIHSGGAIAGKGDFVVALHKGDIVIRENLPLNDPYREALEKLNEPRGLASS